MSVAVRTAYRQIETMKFFAACLLAFALGHSVARGELTYQVGVLPTPARAGALGPSLAKAPDGTVWLSWLEPAADGTTALRFSTLDLAGKKWRAPRTIASGPGWMVKSSDFPLLSVGAEGRVTVVWSVANPPTHPSNHTATATGGHAHDEAGYHAVFSLSTDAGATWSPPAALTRESDAVEFVSLAALADGRVLAAWLDGRAKKTGSDKQQLFARIVGSSEADTLIDASVCDCCHTSLTAFPDGSALLGYRGRSPEEVRDILVARFADGRWDSARPSSDDHWKIVGCPVNGPRLVSDGPRVLKVWFTGAADEPRVMVSSSLNAGGLYTMAERADTGSTIGRVDALLLRDGTQLVTWLASGGLYLRRYGPGGGTQLPSQLAALNDLRGAGFPRIALAKDFGDTPAQFVATFTRAGESSAVETVLVTLPDAQLLMEADYGCACAPRGDETRGYAIRGRVVEVSPASGLVRVRHEAIPGLIRAGERDFKAAPEALAEVKPGQEVLARTEQDKDMWQMFDVRVLAR